MLQSQNKDYQMDFKNFQEMYLEGKEIKVWKIKRWENMSCKYHRKADVIVDRIVDTVDYGMGLCFMSYVFIIKTFLLLGKNGNILWLLENVS